MAEQSGEPTRQYAPEVVPLHPRPLSPAERQPAPTGPEPLLRTIMGAVLRDARHDQQRTLAEVADAAGISMPYLSEIERGRKEPSSEVLAAVGTALGLDLLDLVARTHRVLGGRAALETDAAQPLSLPTPHQRHRSTSGRSGDVLALAA